jgi:F0F1-type ATP synthase assembly protein I
VSDEEEGELPTSSEQGKPYVADLPGLAAFAAIGTTAAILEAIGVFLGLWADRAWGTAPWGLLIGIALATVAAVVSVVKQIRRFL